MKELTAKDVYDALEDELGGKNSCHYIENRLDDFAHVCVDGDVNCQNIADFLNKKLLG